MTRLLVPLLLLLPTANAGRRARPAPEEEPPAPAPAPAPPPTHDGPLFPPGVVVDPGPVPAGLAHAGAQACAACHPRSYDDWRAGPHAAPPSDAHAAASVGLEGCDVCHRPLQSQRPGPAAAPGPGFDAGAWAEGVTCAACHVRDGAVLVADPAAAGRDAPHPTRLATALADGSACASCHQLTAPGVPAPLYDTWGESAPFREAGVTCLTCHGRAGAEPGFASHDPTRPLEHALSLGLSLPSLALVRGAAPVVATVRVQNSGAGHAVPTGSPWRRVEVRAFLEGPADPKTGDRPRRGEVVAVLGRALSPAPPFAIESDTRLQPGEVRALEVPLGLPVDAPAAGWSLAVEAGVPGDPDPRARFVRRWPLAVE
jgi:hypothetical protein